MNADEPDYRINADYMISVYYSMFYTLTFVLNFVQGVKDVCSFGRGVFFADHQASCEMHDREK